MRFDSSSSRPLPVYVCKQGETPYPAPKSNPANIRTEV